MNFYTKVTQLLSSPALYGSLRSGTMAATNAKAPQRLLHTLQSKSPETCRAERIDFAQLGLPEYDGKFALLIHNLLSPEECQQMLNAAEDAADRKWEGAMVNIGAGRQEMMTDIRLCGRILWDTPEIVDTLLARIKPHLPANIISIQNSPGITGAGPVRRKETWQLTRLNERLRYLKYTKGMYFRRHMDGSYVTPDGSEISFLTVHIYLNGSASQNVDDEQDADNHEKPLKGGATRFFGFKQNNYDVNPASGACLVFQHRTLLHSGEEVEQGTKYTIRTDVMYRKVDGDK